MGRFLNFMTLIAFNSEINFSCAVSSGSEAGRVVYS